MHCLLKISPFFHKTWLASVMGEKTGIKKQDTTFHSPKLGMNIGRLKVGKKSDERIKQKFVRSSPAKLLRGIMWKGILNMELT